MKTLLKNFIIGMAQIELSLNWEGDYVRPHSAQVQGIIGASIAHASELDKDWDTCEKVDFNARLVQMRKSMGKVMMCRFLGMFFMFFLFSFSLASLVYLADIAWYVACMPYLCCWALFLWLRKFRKKFLKDFQEFYKKEEPYYEQF